ncbi:c-di-AMP phosphodiesterase-like protein [Weissella beninensis]|uniref:Cyclic-di-AMP phosphodiesterase n=1 Tax=Periweissella beninensis TaxID=504936 RepID=A0ABT0VHW9_9LACO|nr:c-di-AMP phosphodiesterase-like protein [Periweissella beninensis]MCM2437210.1 DHH family phosphoesterase [Periweissella beninensis]
MRRFFNVNKLPEFLQNSRIRILFGFIACLAVIGLVAAFFAQIIFGWVFLIIEISVLISIIQILKQISADSTQYISDLSFRIERGEQEALIQMPLGIILFNDKGDVSWINPYMQQFFADQYIIGKQLEITNPDLAELIEAQRESTNNVEITWNGKRFSLYVQSNLRVVYMMDVTQYAEIEQRYYDEKLVFGMVSLDNYEEIAERLNDSETSALRSYVTKELTQWTEAHAMYMRRLNATHYFILGHAAGLLSAENDKFSVLDKIRETTSKQNLPVTLSVGIAYNGDNLAKLAQQAQANLDLALGRGGDQVVVKASNADARFYGGKSNPMEKRTRVRARMISQALSELIMQADQVFIMGHSNPDMDSVGAALGLRRIVQMNNKPASIILDRTNVHSDLQMLLEQVEKTEVDNQAFISYEESLVNSSEDSLLIMVDHSKPTISMEPQLYHKLSGRTVIIDHHRRGEEFPQNPMLVYIEPYASSTAELVTELFEYQNKEQDPINRIEATALLAGIQIDTKSFTLRTGTRTFDAASYLRSAGADAALIQQFMKENVNSYMARNHLIESVEIIDNAAIAIGEDDVVYDNVVAAQAADSLLQMIGVEQSFTITLRSDGKVGISARSTGQINVQVVMEKMGGGGHLSNAATQIENRTVSEVRKQLIELLKDEEI